MPCRAHRGLHAEERKEAFLHGRAAAAVHAEERKPRWGTAQVRLLGRIQDRLGVGLCLRLGATGGEGWRWHRWEPLRRRCGMSLRLRHEPLRRRCRRRARCRSLLLLPRCGWPADTHIIAHHHFHHGWHCLGLGGNRHRQWPAAKGHAAARRGRKPPRVSCARLLRVAHRALALLRRLRWRLPVATGKTQRGRRWRRHLAILARAATRRRRRRHHRSISLLLRASDRARPPQPGTRPGQKGH